MPSCQEEMGLQHKVWRFPKLLDYLKLTATARKLPIEQNLTSRKLGALTLVVNEQRACLGEILRDVVLGGRSNICSRDLLLLLLHLVLLLLLLLHRPDVPNQSG